MTTHTLTIDLEDWHQLVYRRVTGDQMAPTRAVVTATYRLLDALQDAGVRATFFVLGIVAEPYPELVREIARRGHEIASHGYSHRVIQTMEPEEFHADVLASRQQLQDLSGQPVIGFRAPEFSVGALDHWSFAVLADAGFLYDSSVFPVKGPRYGIPDAPHTPFVIETRNGPIREFPLATWEVANRPLPIAGGTYFRLWPASLLKRALGQMDRAGETAVLYFHPYEFHTSWLYLSGLRRRQLFHAAYVKYLLAHNLGTGRILQRLSVLLNEFEFRPLGELYRSMAAAPVG
ncbi:MAG: polysaccharide deacetylase family protein [Chloroflexi bacterium]|nr:polysaccharide deacetylase family protein [Chloroflexota bacterium]